MLSAAAFAAANQNDIDVECVSEFTYNQTTHIIPTTTPATTSAPTTTVVTTTEKPSQSAQTTRTPKPAQTNSQSKTIYRSFSLNNYSEHYDGFGEFKSWTNFRKSVKRRTAQWNSLTSVDTWTDDNGFRRKGNDYMVAMGSYYTHTIGDRFRITTENGSFTVSICDFKADRDTDAENRYTVENGCVVEFYVDNNVAHSVINSGSASSIPELSGKVIAIEKI